MTLRRVFIAFLAVMVLSVVFVAADTKEQSFLEPSYGEDFNKQWRDGHAELAGYQLSYPQYGEIKQGTAVTIFVTEPLRKDTLVKDDWPANAGESVEVVKLNLVEDFTTGIYDYNLMTSTFVNTKPVNGLPAGSLMKVSYSQQEWCGNVYMQTTFKNGKAHLKGMSYWEGEAMVDEQLDLPDQWISYDGLWHWVRGLAAPTLEPGESVKVKLLAPVKLKGMKRKSYRWYDSQLTREAGVKTINVPAGVFQVEAYKVDIQGYASLRFEVEAEGQRRIIRWQADDGYKAELKGSKRLKYWEMTRNGMEKAVKAIGLTPVKPQSP